MGLFLSEAGLTPTVFPNIFLRFQPSWGLYPFLQNVEVLIRKGQLAWWSLKFYLTRWLLLHVDLNAGRLPHPLLSIWLTVHYAVQFFQRLVHEGMRYTQSIPYSLAQRPMRLLFNSIPSGIHGVPCCHRTSFSRPRWCSGQCCEVFNHPVVPYTTVSM